MIKQFRRFLRRKRIRSQRKRLGKIFEHVQLSRHFTDSKTFADSIPASSLRTIRAEWEKYQKQGIAFEEFLQEHFILPEIMVPSPVDVHEHTAGAANIRAYISRTWKELRRDVDAPENASSRLLLPRPYIVPGGRFREIYYWDSYFTMLGLRESNQVQLMDDMVANFAYLIDQYGCIPNGTRSYYLSRSQPPFFSLMVQLLASVRGVDVYKKYLPAMTAEYNFWMRGKWNIWFLMGSVDASERVVSMPDGELLNRYCDDRNEPREESYREDVEMFEHVHPDRQHEFYRNLRTGAETGWDFSSRWCETDADLTTLRTIDMVPVDLNALLVMVEEVIAEAHAVTGDAAGEKMWRQRALKRAQAIRKYLWNEQEGWFCDYLLPEKRLLPALTAAGMFSLFSGVATQEQAARVAHAARERFLKPGGFATTLVTSREQWDAPNGWAPLQHIAIMGFERYGYSDLARDIVLRWCELVVAAFKRDGTLLEKYNIEDVTAVAGGGEYELQKGFGWTNGVTLFLMNRYGID